MSATIALLPEVTPSPDSPRWSTAPRWVAPRGVSKYWHVPRSVSGKIGHGNVYVSFWCGQSRWVDPKFFTSTEPKANRCATCDGRSAGYEREGGRVFRPRSAFDRPRACPVLWGDDNRACPYCGGKAAWRRVYDGMYYDPTWHVAGPLLTSRTPCPQHGWRRMQGNETDGALRVDCAVFDCKWRFNETAA